MITNLGTVFIRVSKFDEARQFYTNAFGFELLSTEEYDGSRIVNFKFPNSSTLLSILETKSNYQPISNPIINLQCENIHELHEKYKNEGYKVSEIFQWSSEWNDHFDFDVCDPDGQPINLICWTPKAK